MMQSVEIKQGTLVTMGNTLGIILQDEMKFRHYNHYAWVYYFNSRHHKKNPRWVFLGSLTKAKE